VRQEIRHKVAASLHPAVATALKNPGLIMRHPIVLTTVGDAFRRRAAEDPETPWWNRRAIRYLSRHLRPGDRAFEWGSGGSTVWLARRGVSVTSIEHDPEWAKKVIDCCPAADVRLISGATQGRLRSEQQQEYITNGQYFFDDYVAAIDTLDEGSLDIVIVDGLCRMECVRRGAPKVKPGGVLMVDDTDYRFLDPEKILPGWKAVSFWGFKRTQDLRETSFFRRPK
jgi:Methyltransferase domain